MKKISTKKGYTLLFAVIVSTIVLAVAIFVTTTTRKEFILASASRDSTVAIYAADSGIECAVEAYNNSTILSSVTCNSTTQNPSLTILGSAPANTTFQVNANLKQTSPMVFTVGANCFILVVTDGDSTDGSHLTVIDSKGYNVGCTGSVPTAGPRDEERAIRLTYHS